VDLIVNFVWSKKVAINMVLKTLHKKVTGDKESENHVFVS
jgi:hypothetical protein